MEDSAKVSGEFGGPSTPPIAALSMTLQGLYLQDNSAEIAKQALAMGQDEIVRGKLQADLIRELKYAAEDATCQYHQAALWRQWNIWLGLLAGALIATSGSLALVTHVAAAIIGLVATFVTGSLTTLNAGHRKTQAHSAGNAYQEIEAAARHLLNIELPYIDLAEAIRRTHQLTARHLQINQLAEPPTSFANRTWKKQEPPKQSDTTGEIKSHVSGVDPMESMQV